MGAVSFNLETPSASFLAGNVGFLTGFEHIQSFTVSSYSTFSVTFSEIPQYYRHLQIRATSRSTRSDGTNPDNDISIRFNSDSGSNYAWHYLYGNGSSASSGAGTTQTFGVNIAATTKSFATSNVFGTAVIDLLDYSSTLKNKTIRSLAGIDNNGSGAVSLSSSLWMNTGAINSILLYPGGSGALFAQFSTFSLYGIR